MFFVSFQLPFVSKNKSYYKYHFYLPYDIGGAIVGITGGLKGIITGAVGGSITTYATL